MFKIVILLCAVACVLSAAIPEGMVPQLDGRIVGGLSTTIESFPYQISIQRNNRHSCGGTIYSTNIIITAAHCLQNVNSVSILKVRAGSTTWKSGGQLIPVASFKNHEGYNPSTMDNDIAVIKLASTLNFGPGVKSIPLTYTAPKNGVEAVVSGWGTTSSGSGSIPSTLQYVKLNILERSQCSSSVFGYGTQIKTSMICASAAGKDSCQGDSGGPLVASGTLVGVVSWGYGCAYPNYPGVYADVAYFRTWLINTISII